MNMSASLKPRSQHDRLRLPPSDAAELRAIVNEVGGDSALHALDRMAAETERSTCAGDIERIRDALAAIPWDCASPRPDFDAAINWHGARLDELLARLRAAEPTEVAAR